MYVFDPQHLAVFSPKLLGVRVIATEADRRSTFFDAHLCALEHYGFVLFHRLIFGKRYGD